MTKFFELDFLEAGEKGSGDAIALRYRDETDTDYVHVVDGGYTNDGEKLAAHIRQYYDDTSFIDHVVLTHPDGDHAAGLKTILEEFNVGCLWMNRPWKFVDELMPRFNYEYTRDGLIRRLKKDFSHTAALEQLAEAKGIKMSDAFQGANIGTFTVLAPSQHRYIDLIVDSEKTPEPQREATIKGYVFEQIVAAIKKVAANWGEESLKGESEGTSRENEASVVQLSQMNGRKILLTGDAGIEALNEAFQYAENIGVELPGIDRFQVPHHGSRRNLSSETLDKWLGGKLAGPPDNPAFTALVSANRNDDTHPKLAVVRALMHRGAKVFQTRGALCTSGGDAPDRGWSDADAFEYPDDTEE